MAIAERKPQDIILKPVVTEKAISGVAQEKKYTFKVRTDANKIEIKHAVEALYKGVFVEKVNTVSVKGKKRVRGRVVGSTSDYKKAVVKVTADSKPVEFFESFV